MSRAGTEATGPATGDTPRRLHPLVRRYRCIVADPPWDQGFVGKWTHPRRGKVKTRLDYPTMTVPEICEMNVGDFAADGCHLWLWTTNQFLRAGFEVMEAWGFRYLAPVTWCKPSGCGAWFVHTTQTLLFGYKGRCEMPMDRYRPTHFNATCPQRHSEKPGEAFKLIESISPGPRLEVFARPFSPLFEKRPGWDVFGNEVTSDVRINTPNNADRRD